MTTYSNSHSVEDTITAATETITFPWPMLHLTVTNDSLFSDLKFRFSTSESYRTLYPGETTTIADVRMTDLHINATGSVAYRIWTLG